MICRSETRRCIRSQYGVPYCFEALIHKALTVHHTDNTVFSDIHPLEKSNKKRKNRNLNRRVRAREIKMAPYYPYYPYGTCLKSL